MLTLQHRQDRHCEIRSRFPRKKLTGTLADNQAIKV